MDKFFLSLLNLTVILLAVPFAASAARLPVVGSDSSTWGSILNEYLLTEHGPGGRHTNISADNIIANGNVGIGTTAPRAKLDVAGGSERISVTNPTLETADYSFVTSRKALAVDAIINADLPGGPAVHGQMLVDAGARLPTSYQGVTGSVRVKVPTEVYGVLGYTDWQHTAAGGAGVGAVIRGMVADGLASGIDGVRIMSEGNYQPATGIRLLTLNANDYYHYGILLDSATDVGFYDKVAADGIGMHIINGNKNGDDSQTALLLERAYVSVGDTEDIVFGTGNPTLRAGAIKSLAWAGGEQALTINLMTGVADGYNNEVMRIRGDGRVGIGTTEPATGAKLHVADGSIRVEVTNPSLLTPDFSFFRSYKGVAVDAVFDSKAPAVGHAIKGQIDIASSAPTAGAGIGMIGSARVANAMETYGLLGYVDWQNANAGGSGILALTRGMVANPGEDGNIHGIISVSEGDYPATAGLKIFSSADFNRYYYGVRIDGTKTAGVRASLSNMATNPTDMGYVVDVIEPSTSANQRVGLFLDRNYNNVGDSMDIVWGSQGTGKWGGVKAGALKVVEWTPGETAMTFGLSTGGGDAYSNEVMRIRGDGRVGINTATPARALHIKDVMRLEPRSTAPPSPSAGDIYFDSDSKVLCLYNGVQWNALGGTGPCA